MRERTLLDSPFEWRAAIVSEAPRKPGSTPRAREVFLKNSCEFRVFFTKFSLCPSQGSLLSGLPCQTTLEQCTESRASKGWKGTSNYLVFLCTGHFFMETQTRTQIKSHLTHWKVPLEQSFFFPCVCSFIVLSPCLAHGKCRGISVR